MAHKRQSRPDSGSNATIKTRNVLLDDGTRVWQERERERKIDIPKERKRERAGEREKEIEREREQSRERVHSR